jgi:hypothetical protein
MSPSLCEGLAAAAKFNSTRLISWCGVASYCSAVQKQQAGTATAVSLAEHTTLTGPQRPCQREATEATDAAETRET